MKPEKLVPLEDLVEQALNDYWFSPKVSWVKWPRAGDYIAARLRGKEGKQ